MKNYPTVLAIVLIEILSLANFNGQTTIESALDQVAKNNKSILANQKYWEAKKLLFRTGLNPSNPKIEYEYMTGSQNTGNQTDFLIVQTFDFPTAYLKKNQLSNRKIMQSDFQMDAFRQGILLKAKAYCLELIYLNKKSIGLANRVEAAEKISLSYQAKLKLGEANALEVNKAKLQLFNWQNAVRLNTSELKQYHQKLTELNGGVPIPFTETNYPISPVLPDFNTLEKTIEANDPNLKSIHQQNEIDQKKLELSKAMALPKLEGGYRIQEFSGQKFQGLHVGITIPLWENKNRVKHQKLHLNFNDLQVEEHHIEHHFEIQQLYEQYSNLKLSIHEYSQLIQSINSTQLLDKALALGEISVLEYIMEINYFYTSHDAFLSLEKEYNQVIAALYKFEL